VLTDVRVWSKSFCNTIIFLVNEGTALKNHTSVDFRDRLLKDIIHPLWNFDARIIIFTSGDEILEAFDTLFTLKRSTDLVIFDTENTEVRIFNYYPHIQKLTFMGYYRSFMKGNQSLFPDKFKDYQGAYLTLSTIEHPPSVYYVRNSSDYITDYTGIDIKNLESISSVLNFKIEYIHVSEIYKWAKQLPNGTWKGIVGDLINGDSDIGAANIFIEERRMNLIDFTTPISYTKACFAAPGAKPLPRWSSPIRPLSTDAWYSLAAFILIAIITLIFVSKASMKPEANEYNSWSFDMIYVLGFLSMRPPSVYPKHDPLKIYLGFLWLFSILVTIMYSANLISFLSIVPRTSPIKTLKQLDETGIIITATGFYKSQLLKSEDVYLNSIAGKVEPMGDFIEAMYKVASGTRVTLQNTDYLDLYISTFFSGGDGSAIRMVDECFNPYSAAFALQRFSPYKKSFDKVVMSIFESGLNKYWKFEVNEKFRADQLEDIKTTDEEDIDSQQPLTLDHLQGVFMLFCIGILLSTVMLLLEILLAKI